MDSDRRGNQPKKYNLYGFVVVSIHATWGIINYKSVKKNSSIETKKTVSKSQTGKTDLEVGLFILLRVVL